MIEVRKEHAAFALGSFTELGSSNPPVLAYVREYSAPDGVTDGHVPDVVVCVNNLSRFPQPVELDLSRFNGWVPVELTGRVHFPAIGELPYLLTLPGHGFYWFQLTPPEDRV
jgi:maltose alpha-D-glucosyltransferase/alpha-amylase